MTDKIRKLAWCLLVASGVVTGFAVAFPKTVGFLEWVSIIPAAVALMLLCESAEPKIKKRKIYAYGLLFFMSYYLVIFHWFLYMYPMEFTGMSRIEALIVVVVAWIGLSAFQAIGSALIFPIYAFVSQTKFANNLPIVKPLLAAALWAIFEWLQTFGWWGVPWGRLPIGQADTTVMIQSASLFGSYFITFCIVAVNFLLAYGFIYRKKEKLAAILCVSIFVFNLVSGIIVSSLYINTGESITVAAIQGNISSGDKWDEGKLNKSLEIYRKYTEEAAEKGAELVVWPETAIPYNVTKNAFLIDYVSQVAKDTGVTLLVSAFTEKAGVDGLHNSVIEVKPDGSIGENIYSKRHLVPFGEFVPMRDFLSFVIPPLANVGMIEKDLAFGEASEVMDTAVGRVGCEICFDSIYEHVTLEAVRDGAQIISISTNDSWFEDSAAARMHNYQSSLRAVESGRYIVRSANTGISSIINPRGEIEKELGALKTGFVIGEVYARDNVTLYSVIGNLFVCLCIAFAAIPEVTEIVDCIKNKIKN